MDFQPLLPGLHDIGKGNDIYVSALLNTNFQRMRWKIAKRRTRFSLFPLSQNHSNGVGTARVPSLERLSTLTTHK